MESELARKKSFWKCNVNHFLKFFFAVYIFIYKIIHRCLKDFELWKIFIYKILSYFYELLMY